MDLEQLQTDLENLVELTDRETFIFELLSAYGHPKATITRLKHGDYNQSDRSDEIIWKKKLYFKYADQSDLYTLIDEAKDDPRITTQPDG